MDQGLAALKRHIANVAAAQNGQCAREIFGVEVTARTATFLVACPPLSITGPA
jgi:hypothetical protein